MLVALIHNWNMHYCVTVFKGEGRGIESMQLSEMSGELGYELTGFNDGRTA